ncbi:hypothetical protein [Algisphaera agarilytica]|uniref:Uncharacterized protein n=1 Tax=Algisphaera agarilytica TaxID=1385975 RepID=A0A7X0H600_9BACT|nr:hypothetical protein [Algisphaera agarilytica]MBB6429890.1 hypothetical protein [Algisphaera agarilytica]
MFHRVPRFSASRSASLAVLVLAAMLLPGVALAKDFLPADGNLKIREGNSKRSPVVIFIDKGLIYKGERKAEDAILYNFRSGLVRKGRERSGDFVVRIRENAVVDADNNRIFTVSNGKIFGPDDRRKVLYTIGGSQLYRGDNRQTPALYNWSGSNWDNQQTALLMAVLIHLEVLPVETKQKPEAGEGEESGENEESDETQGG